MRRGVGHYVRSGRGGAGMATRRSAGSAQRAAVLGGITGRSPTFDQVRERIRKRSLVKLMLMICWPPSQQSQVLLMGHLTVKRDSNLHLKHCNMSWSDFRTPIYYLSMDSSENSYWSDSSHLIASGCSTPKLESTFKTNVTYSLPRIESMRSRTTFAKRFGRRINGA